jgi:hypothetical protein
MATHINASLFVEHGRSKPLLQARPEQPPSSGSEERGDARWGEQFLPFRLLSSGERILNGRKGREMALCSPLVNIADRALALPVAQILRASQEEAKAENYQFPPDSRADRDGAPHHSVLDRPCIETRHSCLTAERIKQATPSLLFNQRVLGCHDLFRGTRERS